MPHTYEDIVIIGNLVFFVCVCRSTWRSNIYKNINITNILFLSFMIYFHNVTNVLFIFLPTIHYEKFYWKVWDKYFFSRLPIVFEAISYTLANWAIIRGKAQGSQMSHLTTILYTLVSLKKIITSWQFFLITQNNLIAVILFSIDLIMGKIITKV